LSPIIGGPLPCKQPAAARLSTSTSTRAATHAAVPRTSLPGSRLRSPPPDAGNPGDSKLPASPASTLPAVAAAAAPSIAAPSRGDDRKSGGGAGRSGLAALICMATVARATGDNATGDNGGGMAGCQAPLKPPPPPPPPSTTLSAARAAAVMPR
jgi:hypothetical protein